MLDFLTGSGFTPHGFCLLWQPGLIWLDVVSDMLIGAAYFSIPLALVSLARRREDLVFGSMFWLFAAFIVACGATHFMSVVTLWIPAYWVEGWIKAATAILSVVTAALLWPLIPQAVALPSTAKLNAAIATLQATQAKLTEANQWLEMSERIGEVGHFHVTLPSGAMSWSDEVYEIFGRDKSSFAPTFQSAMPQYSAEDQAMIRRDIGNALAGTGKFDHSVSVIQPNGDLRHVHSRGIVTFDDAGKPLSIFGVIADKTMDRLREAEIKARTVALASALADAEASQAQYRLLADHVTDLVVCLGPDLQFTYLSPSCRALIGYTPEELVGHDLREVVDQSDWEGLTAALNALRRSTGQTGIQFRALRKDGSALWIEANGKSAEEGAILIVSMRDISGRKEADDRLLAANVRLEELARVDGLTGLANRRHFDEVLHAELERCARDRLPLSLILIDVDHFKAYNDKFGHPAGDRCLRRIADLVGGFTRRPGDLAARYGGEEMAVVLPAIDGPAAAAVAERIRQGVRRLKIETSPGPGGPDRGAYVTISLGVATLHPPRRADTAAKFIQEADSKLYRAKDKGRDRVIADNLVAT